jgi:hypothetical protein
LSEYSNTCYSSVIAPDRKVGIATVINIRSIESRVFPITVVKITC